MIDFISHLIVLTHFCPHAVKHLELPLCLKHGVQINLLCIITPKYHFNSTLDKDDLQLQCHIINTFTLCVLSRCFEHFKVSDPSFLPTESVIQVNSL